MTGILNAIDQRLQAGQKVYVHCIGGIGRTGITVGCYLARHGLSGEEALLELENLRQQAASWFRRSPESDLQIEFVRRWKSGD
jgi:protein-tyrosine phosphatase